MQTRTSPNIQALHSLAQEANIEGYETMSKADLFEKLKEKFNFERLQRQENRRIRISEGLKGKKRSFDHVDQDSSSSRTSSTESESAKKIKRYTLNKIDPIMFTPIKKNKDRVFKLTRPNGGAVVFNIDTLIDYISQTGDFTDPITRIPFSDEDLQVIDAKAKKLNLDKPSLLELKRNPNAFAEFKFRRDALLGLERCAGEVVTDILKIVETCDSDEAQMRLLIQELPAFADYYRQLKEADTAYASQCMAHWKLYLEGPPNKPNPDQFGLLELVCGFFKACENGSFPLSIQGSF